ncbi:hypothetical protein [Comamonas antarctica]|uniref:Tetratricopeptide repeat-containing protein n=1 Tax=Comamonas antarctica TaxID=2743470 RepID=A0A6N1X4L8_9BURK|nr:hypothetical protein [Comamonas antarctica]QKV54384.1 hypothetical protein HUK68_16530 [Comamonas antarctica]
MQPPDKGDVQLLIQVGFLAAGRGDVAAALRIFEALAVLRPEQAFAFVGLGSALMNAGRAGEAVQRLQAVSLPPGAEADMLDSFKALALQLAGRHSESRSLLRQLVLRAGSVARSPGARLAARLLGEASDKPPIPAGAAPWRPAPRAVPFS